MKIECTEEEFRFLKGVLACHSKRVWDEAGKYDRTNETQDEVANLYIKEHFKTEDFLRKLNVYIKP